MSDEPTQPTPTAADATPTSSQPPARGAGCRSRRGWPPRS